VIRRHPRPMSDAVGALLVRLTPSTTLTAVQTVWRDAVGATVAGHATPVGERNGILRVTCDAAVWAHELDLMGPELVRGINTALGRDALTDVRCDAAPR
jgi:predicted nucleic acid-binding Zn ribbon protein